MPKLFPANARVTPSAMPTEGGGMALTPAKKVPFGRFVFASRGRRSTVLGLRRRLPPVVKPSACVRKFWVRASEVR